MNVIFWDVDQTLVMTGHAGFMAIATTLSELMGPEAPLPEIDASGRTDNFICREILRYACQKEPTMDEIQTFCRHYEHVLLACMQETGGYVLPNVESCLRELAAVPEIDQLLLTGNSRQGARLKLSHYGLASYFDFDHSAFAEMSFDREDVADRARLMAQKKWGDELERIFIIGDTEHDIRCGKRIGGYTISVATGSRPMAKLLSYDPWRCFPTLPPATTLKEIILTEVQKERGT